MPELLEAIERGPVGDLVFIVGVTGKPLTKESFGNMFRAACNKAGIKKVRTGFERVRQNAIQKWAYQMPNWRLFLDGFQDPAWRRITGIGLIKKD